MRMDPRSERTAEQVLNHLDERELADVIYESERKGGRGESPEPLSGRGRKIYRTLADVISAAARPMISDNGDSSGDANFSALRIFVNRELDDLRRC